MYIVANYKMNGDKSFYSSVCKQLNKLKVRDTKITLCPPFIYLPLLKIKNKNITIGAQDVSINKVGKSTGDVAPYMLKEYGVKYVIVGHSDRRLAQETDQMISQKVNNAINNDIVPIVCVGESKKNSKLDIIKEQVQQALKSAMAGSKVIFAYEPVWAIGTGEIPTKKRVKTEVDVIKKTANDFGVVANVLYGGSVDENNYNQFLDAGVDGFLIGGLSLKVDKFIELIKGVDNG